MADAAQLGRWGRCTKKELRDGAETITDGVAVWSCYRPMPTVSRDDTLIDYRHDGQSAYRGMGVRQSTTNPITWEQLPHYAA